MHERLSRWGARLAVVALFALAYQAGQLLALWPV